MVAGCTTSAVVGTSIPARPSSERRPSASAIPRPTPTIDENNPSSAASIRTELRT